MSTAFMSRCDQSAGRAGSFGPSACPRRSAFFSCSGTSRQYSGSHRSSGCSSITRGRKSVSIEDNCIAGGAFCRHGATARNSQADLCFGHKRTQKHSLRSLRTSSSSISGSIDQVGQCKVCHRRRCGSRHLKEHQKWSSRIAAQVTGEGTSTAAPVNDTQAASHSDPLDQQQTHAHSHKRQLHGCRIVGVGSSAPAHVMSNADLTALVDTNDAWITTRTGIRRRHILGADEGLSDLAAASVKQALEMAQLEACDVDLVLMATSSPDDIFGSACQVQALVGANRALAMDLTAACSGFVLGVITAAQFIRTGVYKNVVVVGADALSRYIDWKDRSTCILFGDGSGAVVMTSSKPGDSCSLLGLSAHSDGHGQKQLNSMFGQKGLKPYQQGTASSAQGSFKNMFMSGQDVFKFAVRSVPSVIEEALKDAGLTKDDVDHMILHQANQRILDATSQRLGVPHHKVFSNLAEYGNTSAASIPLALNEAVRGGHIKERDVVVLAGFGAGLTWASAVVRWM